MKKITLEWLEGIKYKGTTDNGFSFETTSTDTKGVTPVEYLLGAVAGCTIIDVVTMLDRGGYFPDSVKIEVAGEREEEYPKIYRKIHLDYKLTGDELPARKVKFAVKASNERYCSVTHSLKEEIELTYSIYINDEKVK
ncbi:OsmC family protein [candidate division KSB1 bacterium]